MAVLKTTYIIVRNIGILVIALVVFLASLAGNLALLGGGWIFRILGFIFLVFGLWSIFVASETMSDTIGMLILGAFFIAVTWIAAFIVAMLQVVSEQLIKSIRWS